MNNRLLHLTVVLLIIFAISSAGPASAQVGSHKSYVIGSGDLLDITTWKETEFTKSAVLVRIDGRISFPLVGEIEAAGLSPLQLADKIKAGLKEYVTSPVVTVAVMDAGSEKFYILGEVMRTGEYNLRKNITVLQALAIAGGFTEWASKKEIILVRPGGGKHKTSAEGREDVITINYINIVKGKDLSQNMKIRANDTIIVP